MALQEQSFLPIQGQDNRVFGIIAITPTTFTGAEDELTIQVNASDVVLPLKRMTYESYTGAKRATWKPGIGRVVESRAMDYMAVDVDASLARGQYQDHGRLLAYISDFTAWRQPPYAAFKIENRGELLHFLNGAKIATAYPTPQTVTGSNIALSWNISAEFVNVPSATFIDVNWQQEAAASLAPFQPLTVTIGAATSDPGAGAALRPFIVMNNPAVVGDVVSYSTIRIVKVNPNIAVPTGVYTWPLTLTNKDGNTATVNLTLTVA